MTVAQRINVVRSDVAPTRSREFISLARTIALSRGEHGLARAMAHEKNLSPTVKGILNGPQVYDIAPEKRAAAFAGTTTDSSFAAPLADYQTLANAFLESLKNFGAFDKLLPSMRRVPFRTRVGASTSGATGVTVGQGQHKPISNLTLVGGTITEQKAVCILVVTEELARFGDSVAGDLFAVELSNAVAVETDDTFISVLSAGVTPIASGGITGEHARHDLRIMLSQITTNARSRLFLIMTPATAKTLSLMNTTAGDAAFEGLTFNGGEIAGMSVVVSDAVSSGTVLLVDAQQVAAASETIVLDSSRQGSVQMDTSPDSPPTASTNLRSLWQNNEVGLKASRWFGVTKLTTTGVSVLTGANYTGDSPGV